MPRHANARLLLVSTLSIFGAAIALNSGCNPESQGGKLQKSGQVPLTASSLDVPEPPPSPEEVEKARQRIDRAIAAQGGAERLARIKALAQKMHGYVGADPDRYESDTELHIQFPDRLRLTTDLLLPMAAKTQIAMALTGNHGWRSDQKNGVVDMLPNSTETNDLLAETYVQWLAVTLNTKGEGTVLKPLPEQKVNNRPSSGVRVRQPNRPPVVLHFDDETGLLIRLEALVNEANVPTHRSITYLDPKPFDGVTLPTRLLETRNGTVYLEWVTIAYQFPDHIDEKLLQKPK